MRSIRNNEKSSILFFFDKSSFLHLSNELYEWIIESIHIKYANFDIYLFQLLESDSFEEFIHGSYSSWKYDYYIRTFEENLLAFIHGLCDYKFTSHTT